MEFKSVSVNNCYILKHEVFDNRFFTYINAQAIYSASIFHLAFFKGNIKLVPEEVIKKYEQLLIKLYRLNSPYLYIPFEINFHEDKLYQSYYESDHFPLSVWLEEKSLIPFDIFIQIMEDILTGLNILENTGISHLFLTPEEILVPLQWTGNNHVKLCNVGINLLVSSLMNDSEVNSYRKNYYNNNSKRITNELILNISDDIYSFGKIMNQLASFCKFTDDKSKTQIQDILKNILNNFNNFNSIQEIISLFDDYFSKTNRQNILQGKTDSTTYSDQAGFIIPEYNEWHEEAELESLSEIKEVHSNKTVSKTEKQSLYSSITTIFKRLFSRKIKKKSVSTTLNKYTELKISETENSNEENFKPGKIVLNKSESSARSDFKKTNYTNNIYEHTKLILGKIDEHYTSAEIKNEEIKDKSVITDNKNIYTIKTKDTIPDLQPSAKHNKTNFSDTDSKFYINFNKSLEDRHYKRTYKLMQESIKGTPKKERSKQELKLKNLLDEKLKQIDNHYIKNNDATILKKIAIINKIQPMEVLTENKDSEDFNTLLKKELISGDSKESMNSNNINFFTRLLNFIKNIIKKTIK